MKRITEIFNAVPHSSSKSTSLSRSPEGNRPSVDMKESEKFLFESLCEKVAKSADVSLKELDGLSSMNSTTRRRDQSNSQESTVLIKRNTSPKVAFQGIPAFNPEKRGKPPEVNWDQADNLNTGADDSNLLDYAVRRSMFHWKSDAFDMTEKNCLFNRSASKKSETDLRASFATPRLTAVTTPKSYSLPEQFKDSRKHLLGSSFVGDGFKSHYVLNSGPYRQIGKPSDPRLEVLQAHQRGKETQRKIPEGLIKQDSLNIEHDNSEHIGKFSLAASYTRPKEMKIMTKSMVGKSSSLKLKKTMVINTSNPVQSGVFGSGASPEPKTLRSTALVHRGDEDGSSIILRTETSSSNFHRLKVHNIDQDEGVSANQPAVSGRLQMKDRMSLLKNLHSRPVVRESKVPQTLRDKDKYLT